MLARNNYITYSGFEDIGSDVKYAHKLKNDLKRIKRILKEEPDTPIFYGNGWIRVGNETFNGITEKMLNNACKLANKLL